MPQKFPALTTQVDDEAGRTVEVDGVEVVEIVFVAAIVLDVVGITEVSVVVPVLEMVDVVAMLIISCLVVVDVVVPDLEMVEVVVLLFMADVGEHVVIVVVKTEVFDVAVDGLLVTVTAVDVVELVSLLIIPDGDRDLVTVVTTDDDPDSDDGTPGDVIV